jgi:superfamily II DNA or RNA helicase
MKLERYFSDRNWVGKVDILISKGLINDKYSWQDFKDYGLVIIDEVHNFMTEKSLLMFTKISRRYVIGMSATPTRADHLEFLLDWYIGPQIFEYNNSYCGKPIIIHRYEYNCPEPKLYARNIANKKTGRLDAVSMQKEIMMIDPHREKFLVDLILEYSDTFEQILVIGLFRAQLEKLRDKLRDKIKKKTVGVYYGGLDESETRAIYQNNIILGMRRMASESLDIEGLRCMILASSYIPQNDGESTERIEQQIGRVLRKAHTESPVIVDIIDNFSFFAKHGVLRHNFYRDKGFEIINKTLSKDNAEDLKI